MATHDSTRDALGLQPTASPDHGMVNGTVAQTPDQISALVEKQSDVWPTIPGYEIRAKLGEGGMGVVYLAVQRGLNRNVAIKTLIGSTVSRAMLARFWAEAEVMAEVKHPNVVQVIELGESAGMPFMAMEFVAGGSLAKRLQGGVQLPARQAAELMEQVSRGVAAAHDLGIVHRDLKPDNVLLDGETPKVADFGIAKRKAHELTQTNAMMGTPAYMSPEQASSQSRHVGPTADVWSLGVMLYECLSGKRPFTGVSVFDLLAKISTETPPALRTLVDGVPRDLQTIVAKCLAKVPTLRYASAAELADDLRHFVSGEPITARPAGVAEQVVRWVRRKPTTAAAYGLLSLAVALAVIAFVVFRFWREAEDAKGHLETANGRLEGEKESTEAARKEAERLRGIADTGRIEEARLRGIADRAVGGELKAKREVQFLNYAHAVDLAYREYRDNNIARARELLESAPLELRGWEWSYVHRLCNAELTLLKGHTNSVGSASFSVDGRRVVTASADGTARVWDSETGKELALLKGHTNWVVSVSFSGDGRRVVAASADHTARVWDAETGKELALLKGHTNSVGSASFSVDGRRVVTASADNTARVWNAQTGKQLALMKGHTRENVVGPDLPPTTDAFTSAAFSSDGRRVVTASSDHTARVWDAETGKELALLSGHTHEVVSASFSGDGRHVVTASWDNTARVWNAETGKELALLKGHTRVVRSASFSGDGRRVVTASDDTTVRTWDAVTGKELALLKGHTSEVVSAAFSGYGRRVVTASWDNTARVWDAESGKELALLKGHTSKVVSAAFSGDGRRVVTSSGDSTARVWDAESGKVLPLLKGHTEVVGSASVSGDGRRVVTTSNDGTARVWNIETGKELALLKGHTNWIRSATFAGDGRRVVTASDDTTARVWDVETGKELALLKGHTAVVESSSFSGDGRHIVTASWDNTARVWDAETGKELALLAGAVVSASFSGDGRRVVTASSDHTARVWDARTGKELTLLTGHTDTVWSASFSSDSRRIVTASMDKTARVWDAETGKELTLLTGHTNDVLSGSFSVDGRRVVTASQDTTARVWDAETGKLMLTLPGHTRNVLFARFSADGSRIQTAGLAGSDEEGEKSIRLLIFDIRPGSQTFRKRPEATPLSTKPDTDP